jgi:hypothetical protein
VSTWDGAQWDSAAEWQGAPPPSADWGDDWRWWYQIGTDPQTVVELSDLVVEARWNSDSHTMGDGTFRGDLQPGQVTVRMWDPAYRLDVNTFSPLGCMFAYYVPTGAAWCWFYTSFARGLWPSGDPAGADCVFTGTLWPPRLTAARGETNFPSQSANARLAGVVGLLNGYSNLYMPHVAANLAPQTQTVATAPQGTGTGGGFFPSYLALVRDAAANGTAWLSAVGAAAPAVGTLTLNYARWEARNARNLDRTQIIAGPAVTTTPDFVVTALSWAALVGSTGLATTLAQSNTGTQTWGVQGPATMRLLGDVTATSGTEYNAAHATGQAILSGRSNVGEEIIDSIDVQSGWRTSPAGAPTSAQWDPYSHVFAPPDTVTITQNDQAQHVYHIVGSAHRLTGRLWQTTHTLEKYIAPTALP